MGTWTPGPAATGGDDVFVGDVSNELVDGLGGHDTLSGNGGDDSLTGGDGNDILDGGIGADTMNGGAGNDTFYVDNAGDIVSGGSGDQDRVYTSISYIMPADVEIVYLTGNDPINVTGNFSPNIIIGNAANNIIRGSDIGTGISDNDWLDGGGGDDTLMGGAGSDTYVVDSAGDVVSGEAATGTINGTGTDTVLASVSWTMISEIEVLILTGTANINGTGSSTGDTIHANSGVNIIDGRGGADSVSYEFAVGGVTVDLVGGAGYGSWASGDTYISIENATGSAFNDILLGADDANFLNGLAGNDVIYALGGADLVRGGAGHDSLFGDAGDDELQGEDGNDHLTGGLGFDVLNGGAGFDYVHYDNAAARVIIVLGVGGAAGEAANDTLRNIEGVVASAFNDVIIGDAAINDLHGMNGADTIEGRGGNDYLGGGAGHDHLNGGDGADILDGGEGYDYAHYDNAFASILADLTIGGLTGEAAGDVFIDIEGLVGSTHNDVLIGNAADNDIHGGVGNDELYGREGNDYLGGGDQHDHLNGGAGADTLDGGAGYNYARYDNAAAGVSVDLASGGVAGEAAGDVYINIFGVVGSAFADTLLAENGKSDMHGGAGNDIMSGRGGEDRIDGGAGQDTLDGGADADTFVFVAGQANGDTVVDFNGLGANAGDQFEFSGYGTAAQGATFTQIDATHWQITSANGLIVDVITLANGATVDASDYIFGP